MQNPKRHTRFPITLLLLITLCAGLFAPSSTVVEAKPLGANPLDVVISEIAWGGTSTDSADEWIELYNPTSSAINLAGWTLTSSDGSPSINLSGTIPALGYFLLEVDDDFTVPALPADLIYSGGLSNSGEILTLRDDLSNVIDTANNDGSTAWPFGSGSPNYLTMQRVTPVLSDAHPNAWSAGAGGGTPRNSAIDLAVTVATSSTNPNVGDPVTFTITLTNSGFGTATNVEVKTNLPQMTELINQSHTAPAGTTYDSNTGIWTVPSLPTTPGNLILTVTANVNTPGAKTIWAQVWKSDQIDPDSIPANNVIEDDFFFVTLTTTPTSDEVDLRVTKTVNNLTPNVNDNVVFTITVSNLGPNAATSVIVQDDLPAGLTYISDDGNGAYISDLDQWQAGTIAPGASKSLNITARVATNGAKTNTASIFSLGQTDPNPSNNSASVTITPGGGVADLRLAQAAPEISTTVAGQVTFIITVTNDGPYNATNVVVRDKLPTGFTYVSDNSGGTYNKDTGLWPAGAISKDAPNNSKTLRITARVDPSGTLTNYAEIWSVDQSDPDSTPGNGSTNEDDNASVTVQSADLSITKSMDNVNPTLGTNVVFTIRVNNAGPNNATGVQVKDSLPSVYSYVSDDSGGQYNSTTGIWNVGTVNNGETKTLRITATLVTNSIAINWAEVWRSDQVDIDSVPGNDSRNTDDDASAPFADLRLDQTVSNTSPGLNNNFTYLITVTNDGTVGTTGIQVRDKLPTGISYVGHSASTGSYSSTTGIWTVGTLATNASATLTITARITTSGVFINQAEVWKSDLSDPDSTPANNSTIEDDDANTTVYFRPILINEVAWAGTASNLPNDQWIELHNPSSVAVNITGWKLTSSGGNVNITLNGSISAGGFFLLERDDNTTVADISANQIYTGALSTSGETLTLRDAAGNLIDTANGNGGAWPRGTLSPNYATMERQGNTEESDSAWVTNTGVTRNGTNASGNPIYGTPGRANSTGVSPTAVPTATLAPVVIPPRPLINEVLPRPGFDWNQDGRIDIFDEFIEIKNIAPADLNLSGWRLDDGLNEGSAPYTLPDVTLKPGQRIAFYGLQTNILLSDGGDTVRLIDPNGRVYDIFTYSVAASADRSFCRLPDGSPTDNSWFDDCIPTPNLTNTREGLVPVMPGGNPESPVCQLPDTIPADFLIAECRGYGANIWNSYYWDRVGWQGRHYLPDNLNKWESFIE
jgi:uncharacterized repeat protein (TIGR01451 family)